MHERLTVHVYKLCTYGTYFLCYECAENLGRECNSCRVILDRVLIQERSSHTVSEDQTVCCSAIVV